VTYQLPSGETFTQDPMEHRRAETARNAERTQTYLAATKGTPLEASAPEFGALFQAGENVKTGDIIGLQRAEMAAKAKAAEDSAKEAERLRRSPDVATQSKWQHERNLAIMAGRGGMGGGVPVDPKQLTAWEGHKEHAKKNALEKTAAVSDSTLNRIDAELANNGNPLSQAMAIHSAAALSTSMGASGGRVTVQASRDIKEAYGLLDSAENTAYRALHGGSNMPAIVQKAQQAMAALRAVNKAAALRAYHAIDRTAGNSSRFASDPSLGPIVSDEMAATAEELGLTPEDVAMQQGQFGDNGETAAPTRPPHRAAPHHAAPAPKVTSGQPDTLVGPGGKTLTLDPATGKYH
jgi:hypothetical protein